MQFCIFVAPALSQTMASSWASAVDTVRVLTLYVFSYDVLVIFSFLFALIYGCFWIGSRMDLRDDERKAELWQSLDQNWKKTDEP
ncbi:hypothetical protein GGQ85_001704 [Nitrobacter vulgaris]|uniref:hypothetical protein n=1 Tax=Nitrobacter vulgaris TaxID=29421 RepID=UPI002866FD6D|nr:hypothetical protein [Nitrobacter vulgaris]MDR6304005.1 hypothetical protein [Nitrobacter vulgaris]